MKLGIIGEGRCQYIDIEKELDGIIPTQIISHSSFGPALRYARKHNIPFVNVTKGNHLCYSDKATFEERRAIAEMCDALIEFNVRGLMDSLFNTLEFNKPHKIVTVSKNKLPREDDYTTLEIHRYHHFTREEHERDVDYGQGEDFFYEFEDLQATGHDRIELVIWIGNPYSRYRRTITFIGTSFKWLEDEVRKSFPDIYESNYYKIEIKYQKSVSNDRIIKESLLLYEGDSCLLKEGDRMTLHQIFDKIKSDDDFESHRRIKFHPKILNDKELKSLYCEFENFGEVPLLHKFGKDDK